MKVRYQIVVEVTADGYTGARHVEEAVRDAVMVLPSRFARSLQIGKVRIVSSATLHEEPA